MEADQESRIKALEEKLAEYEKARRYQKGAEFKVIEVARAYAMMKTFGKTIDANNGCTTSYCPNDQQRLEKYYQDELLDAANRLLLEDSLAGRVI